MRIQAFILIGLILLLGSTALSDSGQHHPAAGPGSGKSFLYTVKKFGVPILKIIIKIDNGFTEQGKSIYQIQAHVDSFHYLGLLFRMRNRFTSIIDAETYSPVRYVKEIDQEGLFIKKKNYLQTLTFDTLHKKVVMEKPEGKERQEVSIPPGTYDPLSMFARYYLKEELHPEQNILMSIYDGVKLRQMVFHSKKERVKSKMYGEVEAVCIESSTSFSTFGENEGVIRIWYTSDGGKTPISMELDLPVGKVKVELEEVREG